MSKILGGIYHLTPQQIDDAFDAVNAESLPSFQPRRNNIINLSSNPPYGDMHGVSMEVIESAFNGISELKYTIAGQLILLSYDDQGYNIQIGNDSFKMGLSQVGMFSNFLTGIFSFIEAEENDSEALAFLEKAKQNFLNNIES